MNYKTKLADRTKRMSGNVIREILKATEDPEIISLAGGLPAPETFPVEIIDELHSIVLEKYGVSVFQYAVTEGFMPFRKALVEYVKRKGITAQVENVYVTNGSQGALDAMGKILLTKGDTIAVEAPTYLGAMTAFNPYEPDYMAMETDDEGLIPESLEEVLKKHNVKIVYLVPTFQNPTGRTLSLERRKKIAKLLQEHQTLAIEDDPYGDLRYRGKSIPSIQSLAPENVLYTSTLSKIFSPGMRLGFAVVPKELGQWMTFAKQGADLHTNTYSQALATEYLQDGYMDEHLPKIIAIYKPRQEAMLTALNKYLPGGFRWSKPEGGMFIWIEGPNGMDMEQVYWKAIEHKIAFVPGFCFYAHPGEGKNTLRLNFTNSDEQKIEKAVKQLGETFKQQLS